MAASSLHFSPRPNRAAEIHWQEWGSAAFERAAAEHKPVLLAISAVWCHWCHVMDETSYSDQTVIDLINERFVPIRVDNDRRPDVNARYNLGGWPTTAVLTPEGEILRGGTYIPPEAMEPFLQQIADVYADPSNRLEFGKRIAELKARRAVRDAPSSGSLDLGAVQYAATALSEAFDDEHGGFSPGRGSLSSADASVAEPKFPHPEALHFLMDLWSRHPDGRVQTMVQRSLHAMAGAGMYDKVEGGFFRYSTTRDFSVPHFEKMLEDLGALLLACARAGAMFGDVALVRVAADVKRYLDASLWQPAARGYGGSQDADEEYYLRDAAGRTGMTQPFVDPTIYTAWNAQAARALIIAQPLVEAAGIDAAGWTERGIEILEGLWSRMLLDGLMARYFDGAARVRGLLADQAWSFAAALSAFSATGSPQWLNRARSLADECDALYDSAVRAYVDRLADGGEPGRVAEPMTPTTENALMARALSDLSAFTGESRYAERARDLLERFAASYQTLGIFSAAFAAAVLDVLEPPLDIKIVGARDADASRALRDVARARVVPPLRIDPVDPSEAERLSALALAPIETPLAYVCRGTACFARAATPAELREFFVSA